VSLLIVQLFSLTYLEAFLRRSMPFCVELDITGNDGVTGWAVAKSTARDCMANALAWTCADHAHRNTHNEPGLQIARRPSMNAFDKTVHARRIVCIAVVGQDGEHVPRKLRLPVEFYPAVRATGVPHIPLVTNRFWCLL